MKLAMLVVLGSVRVAAADIELELGLAPPAIEATIVDAPNVPVDRYVLVDRSADPPVAARAERKREFRDGPEPLALALVIAGRDHDFVVRVDHDESEPIALALPRAGGHRSWLLVLACGLLAGGRVLARRCWQ